MLFPAHLFFFLSKPSTYPCLTTTLEAATIADLAIVIPTETPKNVASKLHRLESDG